MKLRELVEYLDRELNLVAFAGDHSNNGLQVEGGEAVQLAVFGVDASQALIDFAVDCGADFIFAHHGLSWGGEPKRLIGMEAARFGKMFRAGISLYAAHLPLDAHPRLGNNAELSRLAGLGGLQPFCHYDGVDIGFIGSAAPGSTPESLGRRFATELGCEPRIFGDGGRQPTRVAVVSGGGGLGALLEASARGADLLITGEMEHVMYHPARELGVTVLALGHYASETTGPRALMGEVARRFGIETRFAELPTGL